MNIKTNPITTLITAISAIALFAMSVPAWAHAKLQSATPAANAVLDTTPKEVRIQFNEALEAAFSSIKVTDGKNSEVSAEKSSVDAADTKVMYVSLPKLTPGTYAVHWSAMTRDGHRVKGDYSFTVK